MGVNGGCFRKLFNANYSRLKLKIKVAKTTTMQPAVATRLGSLPKLVKKRKRGRERKKKKTVNEAQSSSE